MDGTRFDALARTLATRLSRRNAGRAAIGATAGLLGVNGARIATAATPAGLERYTGIRHYTSTATTNEIKQALGGLLQEMTRVPGLIDYSVVNGAGDQYITIAVFVDKAGVEAAAALEADWVEANAASLFPERPARSGGPVILQIGAGGGCPCATGTENPCNSDLLVCCAGPDTPPGGTGVCIDARLGCGRGDEPTCKGPGEPCEMVPDHGCCEFYTCFEAICDNPRGCFPEGGPCATDEECCDGPCTPDGTCSGEAACKAPGEPCEMVPEHGCCEGYTCFEGICDNPKGCFDPGEPCTVDTDCCQGSCSEDGRCYCTDPARPDIGCDCDAEDANACGGRPELCCNATCISPMANC